eukprot:360870-Chlamydomonas_euryale.AAC.28
MTVDTPEGLAASTLMVPEGHSSHCLAAVVFAIMPTEHGEQRSPSIDAVPASHATHVPAVAATSELSSR